MSEQKTIVRMDVNGYPTEEFLDLIREWGGDYNELMELIESSWIYPDFFHKKEGIKHIRHEISTGGWSGHEEIIGALQKNTIFWMLCWYESRRGGHYVFEVRKGKGDKS